MKVPFFNGLIQIPIDWTPEQAKAVIEILGFVEEEIWSLYGDDIMALTKTNRITITNSNNLDIASPNIEDDLPF